MYAPCVSTTSGTMHPLRTHPLVILDGRLRENPFYDGPAILKQEPAAFGSDANAQDVEQMLASFL